MYTVTYVCSRFAFITAKRLRLLQCNGHPTQARFGRALSDEGTRTRSRATPEGIYEQNYSVPHLIEDGSHAPGYVHDPEQLLYRCSMLCQFQC
jgi:hypothetical protein